MVEETTTKKHDSINKDELDRLSKEIEQKERQTLDSVKRDVTESVKRELKQEELLRKISEDNAKMQDELKKQRESEEQRIAKLQEEFRQQIEDVKSMRQSVKTNDNPFGKTEGDNKVPFDINDNKTLDQIETESQKAFVEKYGLGETFGNPD
jgi:DNA repair exonuclease SbcCD ATPase subunit